MTPYPETLHQQVSQQFEAALKDAKEARERGEIDAETFQALLLNLRLDRIEAAIRIVARYIDWSESKGPLWPNNDHPTIPGVEDPTMPKDH